MFSRPGVTAGELEEAERGPHMAFRLRLSLTRFRGHPKGGDYRPNRIKLNLSPLRSRITTPSRPISDFFVTLMATLPHDLRNGMFGRRCRYPQTTERTMSRASRPRLRREPRYSIVTG
jgi:hypothetical protein